MSNNLVTIKLSEHDANRLLSLSQREAANGRIWNDYWAGIANQIQDCLNRQQSRTFFHCTAIEEETVEKN